MDITTGEAEFIAHARFGPSQAFPLSATDRFVLWTEAFCSWENQGRMHLFDRETRTLTVLDDGLAEGELHDERYGRLTPDGDIALGTFGAKAIVDGETLEYRAVLPGSMVGWGNDVVWSPDYRYAFYEHRGGHGGLCGS